MDGLYIANRHADCSESGVVNERVKGDTMDIGDWIVERHSGRDGMARRVVVSTRNENRARERFAKIKTDLRQGEVTLTDPAGTVVDRCWAPRARTRLG
jgi:hypothetical protein